MSIVNNKSKAAEVHFRCTKEEKNVLARMAAKNGQSITELILHVILDAEASDNQVAENIELKNIMNELCHNIIYYGDDVSREEARKALEKYSHLKKKGETKKHGNFN